MRNLFFTLAFMLVGTFTFANANKASYDVSNLETANKIEKFQQSQLIVINNFEELADFRNQLSEINNLCEVSFSFSISVGVFSAEGSISGTCQDARDFFNWVYDIFANF